MRTEAMRRELRQGVIVRERVDVASELLAERLRCAVRQDPHHRLYKPFPVRVFLQVNLAGQERRHGDDGTAVAVAALLAGEIDLEEDPDGEGLVEAVVGILPDGAAEPFCEEFAGNVYALADYDALPEFPAHGFCPHEKVIMAA